MNAFNRYLCCTLLLVLNLLSCGETIESTWRTEPLTVDGDGRDWNPYPLQYNEEMNLVYGFVNDDSVLYLMIRFNDQQLARMMAVRGFTFWANNSDDEKKLLGIHYLDENLRENLAETYRSRQRQRNQTNDPSQKEIYPKGLFTLAMNDSLTDSEIKDFYGMNASAGLDHGLYCYEFSIALKGDPAITHQLAVSSGETIKVGMEIAGISKAEQKRMKDEMDQHRGSTGEGRGIGIRGGGGGRSGGGMGGGRGPGNMRAGGPKMPDMDGEEIWITVKLAKK